MLVERLLLKPRRSGRREILVNLSTDMVPGIIGTADIMVTDLPAEEVGSQEQQYDQEIAL